MYCLPCSITAPLLQSKQMQDPGISIRVANWPADKDSLCNIRRLVFIKEQNVPEDMEWDEHDDTATHFLVTLDGIAVATARLKQDGQIGRMAVLKTCRDQGIGSKLLAFILSEAAQQNHQQLYLHAQLEAIPFYENQGFVAQGEVFYEAGIAHRTMCKQIF